MAYIGYARVSTHEQNLDAQIDELKKLCDKIFTDKASGAKSERTGLQDCFDYMRESDTLVITKLDRLARSLKDLVSIVETLKERKINLISIYDQLETETPQGRFFFHIFAAVAEFERDLIRQRTQVGLEAARVRGRKGGRKLKMTQEKIEAAKKLLAAGTHPKDTAKQLGISVSTLYAYIPGCKVSDSSSVL